MTATTDPQCYCFGVTVADLAADARAGDLFRSYRSIEQRCRQGLARCAETNPSGHCCLSALQQWIGANAENLAAELPTENPSGRNCCPPPRVNSMQSNPGKGQSQ